MRKSDAEVTEIWDREKKRKMEKAFSWNGDYTLSLLPAKMPMFPLAFNLYQGKRQRVGSGSYKSWRIRSGYIRKGFNPTVRRADRNHKNSYFFVSDGKLWYWLTPTAMALILKSP